MKLFSSVRTVMQQKGLGYYVFINEVVLFGGSENLSAM